MRYKSPFNYALDLELDLDLELELEREPGRYPV